MIENTPAERRMIAAEVIAKRGDAFVIETEDELIEVFKDYAEADIRSRQPSDLSERSQRGVDLAAQMYAELNGEGFKHDLPAILFLLSRYKGR